ncbi:Cd2+/Zn2+-exporting ATPase [Seinonella peptonophila]|uniref:Cd2+/Zn2+-exporting ATPase n=1 Tax=Seinonella peptonophila TaxID=112248 RepID=A0A1M4WIM1_9BACL|nr:heavy metal translocating P-type ATPase [Seinonella peptonophila]SHE81000.1 Cd2+/Zn2+-exporting ATPase [Seinonella peptonophila]
MKRYGELIAALSSGLLTLIAWKIDGSQHHVAITLFILAYVIGGYVKAKEGWFTLIQERELDVNFLMFFAAIGAASIGYWMEGALLIFIFSLSGALETYTLARSERDLSSLMEFKPDQARIYTNQGIEKMIPSEELKIGDIIVIKPGERIPADGTIKQGDSSIEQAMITGESIPVERSVGDEVYAGTLNGTGMLVVEVSRPTEETLLAKIMKRLEEVRLEVPISQQRIERFEKFYAKAVVMITLLLIVIPPTLLSWTWSDSLYRAMIFLVVASPCALVASIMPALLSAISSGARKGLLYKNGTQVEKMANVRVVAFDKTGTLTQGKIVVTDLVTFANDSHQLIQYASSIERGSEHPIAQAIVQYGLDRDVTLLPLTTMKARAGWGVEAEISGEHWQIGKPLMFSSLTDEIQETITKYEQQGQTVVLIGKEGHIYGLFALQDQIRPEAKMVISELRKRGILTAMLTGDQHITAEAIAAEAGIDLVFSELLPDQKVACIEKLKALHGEVAMIGDGINDAPALAKAQVGIAMGKHGSDITLETADIVLMNDNLAQISHAITMSHRLHRVVKQNLLFALAVILCLIAANFMQSMTLPLGVIGHEGSTLLVILNGLRLLR